MENVINDEKKNNHSNKKRFIIGFIIGVVVLYLVGVFAVVHFLRYFTPFEKGDKFVCDSRSGRVTLIFDGDEMINFSLTGGFEFNPSEEKEKIKELGLKEYMKSVNAEFVQYYEGSCTINGKPIPIDEDTFNPLA